MKFRFLFVLWLYGLVAGILITNLYWVIKIITEKANP